MVVLLDPLNREVTAQEVDSGFAVGAAGEYGSNESGAGTGSAGKGFTATAFPHAHHHLIALQNLYKFNTIGKGDNILYTAILNDFLKSDSYTEFNSYCQKLASGGGLYSRSMVEKRQSIIDNALCIYISNSRKTA